MRCFAFLILWLAGCTQGHAARVPHVVFASAELRFDAAVSGDDNFIGGWLTNTGTESASVRVSATEPFTIPSPRVGIAAGDRARVVVALTPDGYADVSGTLSLVTERQRVEIPIVVTVDPDADADGHDAVGAGGDDCDDHADDVFPGAPERCDGVDQDCDEAVDEDAIDAAMWFDDVDDDGWGGASLGAACSRPTVAAVKRGGDCDDSDAAVNPVATERWYDGVDQDCDGLSDFDRDFDGYDNVPVGDDCNDRAASINPGEPEIWYDGLDEDCSGGSDFDQDLDGVDVAPSGLDCDDTDATILPGATEVDDLADQDCDGFADEDFLARGDLVFSELMLDPNQVDDEDGQYVEITNLTPRPVALMGFRLSTVGGSGVLASGAVVPAEGRFVLCSNTDLADNGGVTCDARLSAALRDPDRVRLVGPATYDEVDTSGWTVPSGASLELGLGLGPDDNDEVSAWCEAVDAYGDGDLGTPGATPTDCP